MGKLFRHEYVGHCVIHAAGGPKSKDVPSVSKDDVAARGHEYANIWIPVRSTAWGAVFYDDGARMNEGRVLDAAAIAPAALKAKSVALDDCAPVGATVSGNDRYDAARKNLIDSRVVQEGRCPAG